MFKHISLRIKLSLAFLLVAALMGVAGIYQVHSVNHLDLDIVHLVDTNFVRRNILSDIKQSATQLDNETLAYGQAVADGGTHHTATEQKAQINTSYSALTSDLGRYTTSLQRDTRLRVPQQTVTSLRQNIDQLATAANAFIDAVSKPGKPALQQQRTALQLADSKLAGNVDSLSKLEDDQIALQDTELDTEVRALVRTILLLVAIVVVCAISIGGVVATLLARSLRKLQAGALRIANGDFSQVVRIGRSDEVGDLAHTFNTMSERLRESYRRLDLEIERNRTLLESLGEGVIAIDAQTNIVLINNAALAILELPAKEKLLGIPVNHAFTISDQADKSLTGEQTPAVVSLQHKQPISDVYTFHRKNGAKILLNISADPVLLKGEVAGSIMTLRDVTKEKEVDRMKTEFISLASHQLRTPLSAIKWFTEMLVSGDAGELLPDQAEFAHNISESTERMIALVNALLNISRIESGRIMIDPKPTNLGELVHGIINDLKAKIEERQQKLLISVNEGLPNINLDPRLIGQVYLNLLTNAIKYTQKGGEISVFISRKDDQIISQVSDNGYGIPKAQQGRLFEKFFRATNAVKVETDGTGLGLYLIKAVIESSGGKIWFESEEGKGSTFWFSIPVSGMKPKAGEVTLDI